MQGIKELMLPQLWHRSQLQLGFIPPLGNFHMPMGAAKKEKKNYQSSLVMQWVKDPVLSLQWLESLLWRRPGNVSCHSMDKKKSPLQKWTKFV